ncbi:LacI family DNA-binding transcriptional regulator [Neoactinobaculum massilliense]|uniref:LacI family DNA-binding transcriptional regulator n=1 Tax=Neoactinobaculum massilliense TaxID=2364794 RepID=UPI0013DDCDF3|nr:LacI family DNA-binding transcriptional regulator [Neoactinobaculum massilliense]
MTKAPTLDDVARYAGVSRTLVSTALRGKGRVAASTRLRILAACKAVGYRPNLTARSLASGRSSVLGVLLADVLNTFFAAVADAVSRHADQAGLTTLIATGQHTEAGERHAVEQLTAQRPQGVVLLGPTMAEEGLLPLLGATPTVSISRVLGGVSRGAIALDEEAGVRLVVEHLAGLGHRSITHIDGGSGVSADERRTAFLARTRAAGVQPQIFPGSFDISGGYRAARALLAAGRLPTAIWAANDRAAAGVLLALREAGVRVPGDVSVMGYDDVTMRAGTELHLTSVRQPIDAMGQLAVERILAPDATDVGTVRLEPSLVVRGSTGPAPTPVS